MAAVGGRRGGRVSILVIPDATRFRQSLKLMLKRVEQSMSANLQVTADVSSAESTLRKFKKDWDGRKVQLGAAMSTAGATAQLKVFTRPRTVPISVKVSQASLVKAATILASLSGGRLANDFIKGLSERLQNLDRALPKIAAVSQGIAGLSSVLLSAVGGTFTLGAGLAQVFGIAAVLPALLAGMATGGVVLALALSDTKNQLADLAPDFQDLKAIVLDNFWAVAAQPIRDFVSSVLPSLRSGLRATSASVGNWSASLVSSFQTALGGGVLDRLFASLVTSIDIASTGTGGFAEAIITLGVVGSAYLPRLATWVADLTNRFADFLHQAEADGSLQRFIEGGITATNQLFDALGSLGSILSGIATAADSGGASGLESFADVLARIAGIINSPEFQATLSTLFQGAEGGAAGLATALAPIGALLGVLAPTLSDILRLSGEVIGKLVGDLGKALESPVFEKGLEGFFKGIQSGLLAIGPALPAIAAALGTFLGFAGELGAQVGPVLGAVMSALAPILTDVLQTLEPMLPLLGAALVDAIVQMSPSLLALVQGVLPLLPDILDFVIAILPLVGYLVTGLSSLGGALDIVVGGFGFVLGMAEGMYTFLGGLIALIAQNNHDLGDWADLIYGIPGPLGDLAVAFGRFIQLIINNVIDAINALRGGVSDFANWVTAALGIKASITFSNIPHVDIPQLRDAGSHAFMATGGDLLATPGGVPFIGAEAGRDERVIDRGLGNKNLALQNRMAERLLSLTLGGAGLAGATITIPVTAAPGDDPRVTAQVVGREVNDIMAGR